MSTSRSGCHVLPCAFDGEPVGFGFWEYSNFAGELRRKCDECLSPNGSGTNEITWNAEHYSIRTKATLEAGAGLLTILVNEKAVASYLLLSGAKLAGERTLAQMFIESLKNSNPIRTRKLPATGFDRILRVQDRPLLVVVTFPESTVTGNVRDRAARIRLHFAAAFFENQIQLANVKASD